MGTAGIAAALAAAQAAFGHGLWLPIVGPVGSGAVPVHQNASVFVARLDDGATVEHTVGQGRAGYLYLIQGRADVDGEALSSGDFGLRTAPDGTVGAAADLNSIDCESRALIAAGTSEGAYLIGISPRAPCSRRRRRLRCRRRRAVSKCASAIASRLIPSPSRCLTLGQRLRR